MSRKYDQDAAVAPDVAHATSALDVQAAWELGLADDHESLSALRRACLSAASEHGLPSATVEAATEPLSAAMEEQIVQRLLREQRTTGKPASRSAARASSRATRRLTLWPVAAAFALCALPAWRALPSTSTDSAAATNDERSSLATAPPRATAHQSTRDVHDQPAVSVRALPPRVGEELTELAEAYAEQRRFDEAAALFEKALREREQRLGPMHKDVADALTRLAALYQTQHLYAKAEPLYVRAFEIDPPFAVF